MMLPFITHWPSQCLNEKAVTRATLFRTILPYNDGEPGIKSSDNQCRRETIKKFMKCFTGFFTEIPTGEEF